MDYDSKEDTIAHINNVRLKIRQVIDNLGKRLIVHDSSKLQSPEKEIFDKFTPMLKGTTYGSDEYNKFLKEMQVGLDHHYANNSHHPQFYKDGVDEMSLLDVVEMFCDWSAAVERHADGDLTKSININEKRFNINPQLTKIFYNTKKELGW
jgi:hypothetical protein